MAKRSKPSRCGAEGPSSLLALRRRPSRLFSLFKKRTTMNKRAMVTNGTSQFIQDSMNFPKIADGDVEVGNQVSPSIRRAATAGESDDELIFFRCDIDAVSGEDFTEAERDCKRGVVDAGGTIMLEYEYVGGFLYYLSTDAHHTNPLANNDKTKQGGHIKISEWKPFVTKSLDARRMKPPDKVNATEHNTPQYSHRSRALPRPPMKAERAREDTVQDWILQTRDRSFRSESTDEEESNGDCITKTTCISRYFDSVNQGSVEAEYSSAADWIIKTACTADGPDEVDQESSTERSETLCEETQIQVDLSPRILDPGVELAILDPTLIRSDSSFALLSIFGSDGQVRWSDVEAHYLCLSPGNDQEAQAAEVPGNAQRSDSESSDGEAQKHTSDGVVHDHELSDATTLCGSLDSSNRYSGVPATAIAGRVETPVLVRSFGEEMRDLEQRYRNWVPDLASRFAGQTC